MPGSREPLFLGPHRMLESWPVAPVAGRVRTCVAIWSYGDRLFVGITGDHDTTPDLGVLAEGVDRGLAALLAEAREDSPPCGGLP